VHSICSAIVNPALLPWDADGNGGPEASKSKALPHVEILGVILCNRRPDRNRNPAAGLAPRAMKGSDGATNWNGGNVQGLCSVHEAAQDAAPQS